MPNVVIFVKNMKHPYSAIIMNLLQNVYTPIQISKHNILFFSCWLRGNSTPTLLKDKVEVGNSFVKKWIKKMWIKSSWI